MADGRERSAAEREAARLERERRRSGAVDQPGSDGAPGAADGFLDWSQTGGQGAPDEGIPRCGGETGADADMRPVEPTTYPAPPAPPEPLPEYDTGDLETGDVPAQRPPFEVASGTRRVSRLESDRRPEPRRRPARSEPRRRPAGPAQRGEGATRRKHSLLGRLIAVVALLLAAAVIWFGVEIYQPFGTSPHGRVTVVVPSHSSATQIGTLLGREGVIAHPFFFKLRATLGGERGQLRSGTYHFALGMSYASVLTALTKAPPAARTTELTLAEGHTRQYVAKLLRRQKIKGNYLAQTRHSPLLNPRAYGAPRNVPSLEGFLFPDTFQLVEPIKTSTLVDDQLRDFKQRLATVNMSYARSKHLTPYDVLKVASLIEAEAAAQRDRPLVASVIYNRLHDGMMLQLDSTARYATGNFTRPLTVSQLHSSSPYNTHTHLGLPPTPIDSPGLAAIQAAAHPAKSPYLYFFSKPCSNRSVFATSYTQFLDLLARDKRTHCP